MSECYRVAGYVKLAKLWDRNREKATTYHRQYYADKFSGMANVELADVYIDITGQKELWHRPEMMRLLADCYAGHIHCIAAQTKAYLAANAQEFCFLLKTIFSIGWRIDIVTEDDVYNINTVTDAEDQYNELLRMANKYAALESDAYRKWNQRTQKAISAHNRGVQR